MSRDPRPWEVWWADVAFEDQPEKNETSCRWLVKTVHRTNFKGFAIAADGF